MASMGGWLVLGTAASQARARCGRLSHAPREGKNVGGVSDCRYGEAGAAGLR